MNPIAKKLLYSTLGGAAPGALVGAAVSEEDNRLRNALIGAGLGGAAGAGIYSAKRLGDVNDLNKVYDDLLSDRPVASTMDDLGGFEATFMTRSRDKDYATANLTSEGKSLHKFTPKNNKYKMIDLRDGDGGSALPFTKTETLRPNLDSPKTDLLYQYDPGSKRTVFYIANAPGRSDRAGRTITDSLSFSVPGEASELAKKVDKDYLESLMRGFTSEVDSKGLYEWIDSNPRLNAEQISKFFGGSPDAGHVRKTVDLSPKFNEGSRGSFFQDPQMPSYGEVVYMPANEWSPAVMSRLEKRSSLKLRGKSRLRRALINAASASRK